jgi:hypothetical protein
LLPSTSSSERWTGTGSVDVFIVIDNDEWENRHKYTNLSITEASTTVAFSDFEQAKSIRITGMTGATTINEVSLFPTGTTSIIAGFGTVTVTDPINIQLKIPNYGNWFAGSTDATYDVLIKYDGTNQKKATGVLFAEGNGLVTIPFTDFENVE